MNWPAETTALGAAAFAAVLLTASSAHAEIPHPDGITPGELRGIALLEDSPWPASYWEYLPGDFDAEDDDTLYPVLMTLGGIGTMDNISVCPGLADTCTVADCEAEPNVDGLCRVYRRGPAVEIRAGAWDDVERPFIVIQPQNRAPTSSAQDYDRDELDDLMQFVVDNYPADPRRLYIMGNSQGGRATYQYLALYARRVAAGTAGPGGVIAEQDFGCRLGDTPLWAFHGENDVDSNVSPGAFDPCFVARNVSRANEPELYDAVYDTCLARQDRPFPESRITMFQDTAHNAWTPAFENVTQGFSRPAWTADEMCGFETNWVQYDDAEYPDGVYTWLLEHDRPGVDAGGPVTVPGDVDLTVLAPTIIDDDAWEATWEQTAGPAVTMTPGAGGALELSDFEYDATYSFQLLVLDADNQWEEDTVEVTIEPEVIDEGSSSSSAGDDGSGTSGEVTSTSTGPHGTGEEHTSGDSASTDGDTGSSASASASASGSEGNGATGDSSPGSGAGTIGDAETDTDSAGQASSGGGCRFGGEPTGFGGMLLLCLGLLRRRRSLAGEARRARVQPQTSSKSAQQSSLGVHASSQ